MGVYSYREREIEGIVGNMKRLRMAYCVGAAAILVASGVVAMVRPEWIFGAGERARAWVLFALFVFFGGPLGENLWRWKKRPVKLEEALRAVRVEVCAEEVRLFEAGSVRQLKRSEIRRAEEVSWGMYLRTANRYRWILIPRKIEEFEAVKAEIEEIGIPVVEAGIAPNCEEFVGVVVFAGTMICAIFAQSAWVLGVNLLISLVVAVGGFVIVGANPENAPKMRWARLGIFLPVAMTASMLWGAW
jgi:hypothetical protein